MNQQIGDISNSNVQNTNTAINIEESKNPLYSSDSGYINWKCVRKWLFQIIFFLNVVFLGFNIYYLCHYYPSLPKDLGLDYTGIIVGILSILVTILIGWNIFTVLDVKKEWKETQKKHRIFEEKMRYESVRIKQNIENISEKNLYTINTMYSYIDSLQGEVYLSMNDCFTAYREYILAAKKFKELENTQGVTDIRYKIEYTIRQIASLQKRGSLIRDYDFFGDISYKDAELSLDGKFKEYIKIMHYYYDLSSVVLFGEYRFFLFKKSTQIRERKNAIYLMVTKEDNELIHKNRIFLSYEEFSKYRNNDIYSSFDFIAIKDVENDIIANQEAKCIRNIQRGILGESNNWDNISVKE